MLFIFTLITRILKPFKNWQQITFLVRLKITFFTLETFLYTWMGRPRVFSNLLLTFLASDSPMWGSMIFQMFFIFMLLPHSSQLIFDNLWTVEMCFVSCSWVWKFFPHVMQSTSAIFWAERAINFHTYVYIY